jgi:hypothetical protein
MMKDAERGGKKRASKEKRVLKEKGEQGQQENVSRASRLDPSLLPLSLELCVLK